jgi:thioredoxin reductase (NADPH)
MKKKENQMTKKSPKKISKEININKNSSNKMSNNKKDPNNNNNKLNDVYDVLILGGGPAGMSAAIYAKRFGLKLALVTREIGGDWVGAHKICNYLGFKEISGDDLAKQMLEHSESQGVSIIYDEVKEIFKKEDFFEVKTNLKSLLARKVIFATGAVRKKLEIKGEKELLGKGVSYCANCDAAFFKNKIVAVIGGGNAAISAAVLLAQHAKKIYIIYRKSEFFRPENAMLKIITNNPNVEIIFNDSIAEIAGKQKVESILLANSKKRIQVDGVFIEIGSSPNLNLISQLNVDTKDQYILVDLNQETNIKGFYAAGDIVFNDFKQIVVAASQGAVAVSHVYKTLKKEDDSSKPLTQY